MEEDNIDPKLEDNIDPKLEDTEKNLIKIDDPLQMLTPLFEVINETLGKSDKVAKEEMQILQEILEELKGIREELKNKRE